MNILLFVVSAAISIAAVSVYRFAVISMIDPDRVTVGNHNNYSILFLTVLLILSFVLSVKNKGSMRKRKLFEAYLYRRVDSLPLLAYWKPNPPVEGQALTQAVEWHRWKCNARWWNILDFGEPDITAWNLYITHLYDLADALELSFSELIRHTHGGLYRKLVQPNVQIHLNRAAKALKTKSYWIAHGEYNHYKGLIDAAHQFRLVDHLPIFETYDKFIESQCLESVHA